MTVIQFPRHSRSVTLTTGSSVTDDRLVSILHLLLSHEQMKLLARALDALDDPDRLRDVAADILKLMPLKDSDDVNNPGAAWMARPSLRDTDIRAQGGLPSPQGISIAALVAVAVAIRRFGSDLDLLIGGVRCLGGPWFSGKLNAERVEHAHYCL